MHFLSLMAGPVWRGDRLVSLIDERQFEQTQLQNDCD
jgi:hypothetical protein